jgi:hypothetical protein
VAELIVISNKWDSVLRPPNESADVSKAQAGYGKEPQPRQSNFLDAAATWKGDPTRDAVS